MTGFSSAIGQFVIGQSPIQGSAVPILGPTSLQKTIPMYLYTQYADDSDLQGFVSAFNALAQEYVDWFNQTPLAIYTLDSISGPLLDWVAEGIYGETRPYLSAGTSELEGPYNTYEFNTLEFNQSIVASSGSYVATSDDVFKRILTWNFFKGDGNQFTVSWLKRRVLRFLVGANGVNPTIDQTYDISVRFEDPNLVFIDIVSPENYDPQVVAALAEGINSGVLQTPFQYQFTVLSGGSGFGYFAFGVSAFGG